MNVLHKISGFFLVLTFAFNANAQELERKQDYNSSQNLKISKRVSNNSISQETKVKKSVSVENNNTNSAVVSERKSIVNNQTGYSPSVPATKKTVNSSNTKNNIDLSINPNLTIIDNLERLIEEKKEVNESYNSTLLNSSDYQTLNNLIIQEKSKFNDYVEGKGIENCSIKEQNYYLSFLKEEGREQEYLLNINKLK